MKTLAFGKTDTKTFKVSFPIDTDFPSKPTHFGESKVEADPYLKSLSAYRYHVDS